MAEDKERRFNDRVKINGACVCYRCKNENHSSGGFSEPKPLEDMTWSSVRFLTNEQLRTGESIDLEMDIPGESKIKAKGHLIWTAQKPGEELHYAVVQLLPFGSGKEYNPLSLRTRLKNIIKKYTSSGN